jgi:hypothetical protein
MSEGFDFSALEDALIDIEGSPALEFSDQKTWERTRLDLIEQLKVEKSDWTIRPKKLKVGGRSRYILKFERKF